MAAMMSRALLFSPLAMGKAEACEAFSGWGVGGSEELRVSGDEVVATGGCVVSFGPGDACSPLGGWSGSESNRLLWVREEFSRAT
jgi:hypothetical protein